VINFTENKALARNHQPFIRNRTLMPEELKKPSQMSVSNIEGVCKAYLVGISGKMGSGKDTVASLLAERFSQSGGRVVIRSFADSLKEEVARLVADALMSQSEQGFCDSVTSWSGMSSTQTQELLKVLHPLIASLLEQRVEPNEVTAELLYRNPADKPLVREVLKFWGNDVRRAQNPDYWVDTAAVYVEEQRDMGVSCVIPDVRRQNEAGFIKDACGLLVRLNVSKEEQRRRLLGRDNKLSDRSAFTHITETDLDDYDRFDLILDTDSMSPEEVADAIMCELTKK
jgi:hypothetical protein